MTIRATVLLAAPAMCVRPVRVGRRRRPCGAEAVRVAAALLAAGALAAALCSCGESGTPSASAALDDQAAVAAAAANPVTVTPLPGDPRRLPHHPDQLPRRRGHAGGERARRRVAQRRALRAPADLLDRHRRELPARQALRPRGARERPRARRQRHSRPSGRHHLHRRPPGGRQPEPVPAEPGRPARRPALPLRSHNRLPPLSPSPHRPSPARRPGTCSSPPTRAWAPRGR